MVDNKKFTWVIKNYSSLSSNIIFSDDFVIGGYKWRLSAFPNNSDFPRTLFLIMDVADVKSLSHKRVHARYILTVVNQNSENLSVQEEIRMWFDQTDPRRFSSLLFPVNVLQTQHGGFVVNDEVKIVVEVEVLEVISTLDIVTEVATQPVKKIKLENDLHMRTPPVKYDVNGFQVLVSQVDFVRRLFEKHPDIALEFRPKNPLLKTSYMNVLLGLIEILRQSPEEMSKEDLADAHGLLVSTKNVGFKVDWLEKKLKEASEKKEKEEAYNTRIKEIGQELKEKDEAYKT